MRCMPVDSELTVTDEPLPSGPSRFELQPMAPTASPSPSPGGPLKVTGVPAREHRGEAGEAMLTVGAVSVGELHSTTSVVSADRIVPTVVGGGQQQPDARAGGPVSACTRRARYTRAAAARSDTDREEIGVVQEIVQCPA